MRYVKADHQQLVQDFMDRAGHKIPDVPSIERYEFLLWMKMILEETLEFISACGYELRVPADQPWATVTMETARLLRVGGEDFAKMIDAICDLEYADLAAASAAGVDIDPFFKEVHATNMFKTTGPRNEDGKRLKPEGWRPPRIDQFLAVQIKIAEKDLSDFLPRGVEQNIPGGTRGEPNVFQLRRPQNIARSESPQNERWAGYSMQQLRQTLTDVDRQLQLLGTRSKQHAGENNLLYAKMVEIVEENKKLRAQLVEAGLEPVIPETPTDVVPPLP